MTARNLHPLTLASIELNRDPRPHDHGPTHRCGCDNGSKRGWDLCQFHEGYEDACQEASESANPQAVNADLGEGKQ